MIRTTSDKRVKALTLVELLVVIAVLAVLGLFIFPKLTQRQHRHHPSSPRINCVNNLKQIGLSFRLWAGDNGDKYPMQVSVTNGGTMELVRSGIVFPNFQVMSNGLSTPKVLVCPSDTRTAAKDFSVGFSNTNVSYFVGLEADESNPQMLLAGDRNITGGKKPVNGILTLTTNDVISWTRGMHNGVGNVALADGHVDQLTSSRLQEALKNSGVATNRLALP